MLAALLVIALAQVPGYPPSRERINRLRFELANGGTGGSAAATPAAFLFADSSGTGMTAACAGTALTTVQGGSVTVTRASARSCLKSASAVTGIVPGDMVDLTSNQPAVQPIGSGVGLHTFEGRTNTVLRNQDMSNAAWNSFGTGVAGPTVSGADAGLGPTGIASMNRLRIPATAAGQRSLLYQDSSCAAGLNAISCFVSGWSTGGVTDLSVDDGANGWIGVPCVYPDAGTINRCYAENIHTTTTGGSLLFAIGNMTLTNGGVARAAADILVTRCQCELGGTMGPSIPTVASAVATVRDVPTASYTAAGSSISIAGTLRPDTLVWDNMNIASLSLAATTETVLTTLGAKNECNVRISDTGALLEGLDNLLTPATQAASCGYAPSSRFAGDGTSVKSLAGALTLATGSGTVYLGALFDGGTANGTVSNICVDATKCNTGAAVSAPITSPNSAVVALFGDSIMKGGFQQQVVEEVQDRLYSRSLGAVTYAVSGAKIVDCASQYHTSIKGQGFRDVATNCGINDILVGTTGANAWADMLSLLNDVTGDGGYHVVLGNLTPCAGNTGCDYTQLQAFNAAEAAWCAGAGASVATCLDNNTLLGASSETLTYSAAHIGVLGNLCTPSVDALHPNNYCTTKLADSFAGGVP